MTAPPLPSPPDWTADAYCLDVGTGAADLWHDPDRTQEARWICSRCPVRLDCARYALDQQINEGVWGGLSVKDRQRVAREFGFDPPGAPHGSRARYVHRTAPCRPGRTGIPCPSRHTCQDAHRKWARERRAADAWARSQPSRAKLTA